MGSMKTKMLIYSLLLSLIASLVTISIVRFSGSGTPANQNMTPSQKLEALEKAAPQSPEMRAFIEHERAAQKVNEDAANALPR